MGAELGLDANPASALAATALRLSALDALPPVGVPPIKDYLNTFDLPEPPAELFKEIRSVACDNEQATRHGSRGHDRLYAPLVGPLSMRFLP